MTVGTQTTQFLYDGDGNMVKKTKPDGSKTIYVGGIYEVDKTFGGTVTQTRTYYPAGGAMRIDNTLYYILKDHLGSASETPSVLRTSPPNPQVKFWIRIFILTCVFGGEPIASPDGESLEGVGEQRYYPYGETRLSTGTIFTDKLFTGQQELTGLGIYNYRARMYSPKLGRFLSADTIVPNVYNPQDLNRYSYVRNNPLKYTDPSGHCSINGHWMSDKDAACQWGSSNQGSLSGNGNGGFVSGGCSVSTGGFNGSFSCSPAALNGATIAQRQGWFNEMLASVNSTLPEQFTNINGILKAFIDTGEGAPDSWTSWGDAGILNSIQNGLALSQGKLGSIDATNPYAVNSANAWNAYFRSYKLYKASNGTLQLWGTAEGLGTSYGILLASEHGATKSSGEMLFLAVGNWYRNGLKDRQDPATLTTQQWSKDFYGWLFDTSSTVGVPYTNIDTGIAPVSLMADLLLRIK